MPRHRRANRKSPPTCQKKMARSLISVEKFRHRDKKAPLSWKSQEKSLMDRVASPGQEMSPLSRKSRSPAKKVAARKEKSPPFRIFRFEFESEKVALSKEEDQK